MKKYGYIDNMDKVKTLFYSITIGARFISTSFFKDILPSDIKLDLSTIRKVLISALWARMSRYFILGWVLIPLRTILGEIIINGVMGDTDIARFLLNKLNIVTIPWLEPVNNLTDYLYSHIQPYSNIPVYWVPIFASLVTLASYIYFNQESPFVNDLRAVWYIIKNNWTRLQGTWFYENFMAAVFKPFNWIINNSSKVFFWLFYHSV